MSDKPLHVQVAEALGETPCRSCMEVGNDPWHYHYDTDWAATGPLIERFKLDVFSAGGVLCMAQAWRPNTDPQQTFRASGTDPLIAVCRLILVLRAAGKLDA